MASGLGLFGTSNMAPHQACWLSKTCTTGLKVLVLLSGLREGGLLLLHETPSALLTGWDTRLGMWLTPVYIQVLVQLDLCGKQRNLDSARSSIVLLGASPLGAATCSNLWMGRDSFCCHCGTYIESDRSRDLCICLNSG